MNINKDTKEKICAFYASDYHFEMISLPYIEKKLETNRKVIVLTENNLEKTIDVLISKINLEEKKKKEILNLNWENNDFIKFKTIKEESKRGKEIIIFVKGKKNYIKNINENIINLIEEKKNLTIIDCYDMEEINEGINEVTENYNKVLTVSGIKEIQKI